MSGRPARLQQAWGTVERHEGALDCDAPHSGEGHDERGGRIPVAELAPPALGEQRCGVVGPQGRHASASAAGRLVAPPEEGVSRQVDRHARTLPRDAHQNAQAGEARIGLRTATGAREEAVHDGVLGTQGHKLGIPQLLVGTLGIDGETFARCELVLPGDVGDACVELVGIAGVPACEHAGHA